MPVLRSSVGQILINDTLPDDLKDHDRVLDKKGFAQLLNEVATRHPEQYLEISHKLANIGRGIATETGGGSFGLAHMKKTQAGLQVQRKLQGQLEGILDDDRLSDKQRHEKIIRVAGAMQQPQMDSVYKEALAKHNPLALQVMSGSRGNKMNLASLLGSDLLYSDQKENVIPFPVLRSYNQGLSPAEYWAGTYGARRGVLATKFATRDAGFLSKQLNQVSHRLVVTGDDEPDEIGDDGKPAAKTLRGVPTDVDDMDNEGALLAHDIGGYKRNTILTPKIMKDMTRRGIKKMLVRSPIVGGSGDGGVYAKDVGVREYGTLPGRGEAVGLTAAQALSEPISQGQLSAKHSGGVSGQEKAVSGFQAINQQIQVPKTFKGGARHADVDGVVQAVEKAPAGGHFVTIEGERHYVGAGYDLKVKKGDKVEAGDVISAGLPNPATVVEHKGIGEGRRYFVHSLRNAMKDAGMQAHRRNIELLSRGLINHVRMTDEYDDYSPDDIVPYSWMEKHYVPREDHENLRPSAAVGRYLERPILHYSIGTKVRPSTVTELDHFGVKDVAVHRDPPPFQPEMIRGMASLHHDPDWMTRMYGSGLKGSLLDAVHRGSTSNELGTSFVPGLARAVDFGRQGLVHQPDKRKPLPPEGEPVGTMKLSEYIDVLIKEAEGDTPSAPKPPEAPQSSAMPKPPAAPGGQPAMTMPRPVQNVQPIQAPKPQPQQPQQQQQKPPDYQYQTQGPNGPVYAMPPIDYSQQEAQPGGGYQSGMNPMAHPALAQAWQQGDMTALDPHAFATLLGYNRQDGYTRSPQYDQQQREYQQMQQAQRSSQQYQVQQPYPYAQQDSSFGGWGQPQQQAQQEQPGQPDPGGGLLSAFKPADQFGMSAAATTASRAAQAAGFKIPGVLGRFTTGLASRAGPAAMAAAEFSEFLDATPDESLARGDAKLQGNLGGETDLLGYVPGPWSFKVPNDSTAGYFLDNAKNMGRNTRSIYEGLQSASRDRVAANIGEGRIQSIGHPATKARIEMLNLDNKRRVGVFTPEDDARYQQLDAEYKKGLHTESYGQQWSTNEHMRPGDIDRAVHEHMQRQAKANAPPDRQYVDPVRGRVNTPETNAQLEREWAAKTAPPAPKPPAAPVDSSAPAPFMGMGISGIGTAANANEARVQSAMGKLNAPKLPESLVGAQRARATTDAYYNEALTPKPGDLPHVLEAKRRAQENYSIDGLNPQQLGGLTQEEYHAEAMARWKERQMAAPVAAFGGAGAAALEKQNSDSPSGVSADDVLQSFERSAATMNTDLFAQIGRRVGTMLIEKQAVNLKQPLQWLGRQFGREAPAAMKAAPAAVESAAPAAAAHVPGFDWGPKAAPFIPPNAAKSPYRAPSMFTPPPGAGAGAGAGAGTAPAAAAAGAGAAGPAAAAGPGLFRQYRDAVGKVPTMLGRGLAHGAAATGIGAGLYQGARGMKDLMTAPDLAEQGSDLQANISKLEGGGHERELGSNWNPRNWSIFRGSESQKAKADRVGEYKKQLGTLGTQIGGGEQRFGGGIGNAFGYGSGDQGQFEDKIRGIYGDERSTDPTVMAANAAKLKQYGLGQHPLTMLKGRNELTAQQPAQTPSSVYPGMYGSHNPHLLNYQHIVGPALEIDRQNQPIDNPAKPGNRLM